MYIPKAKAVRTVIFLMEKQATPFKGSRARVDQKGVYFRKLIKRRGRILFVGVCDFHWVSGDYLKVLKRAHSFRCLTLVLVLHECNVGT